MSNKPPKKSDENKSWRKPRRDRGSRISPEYHLIITEGSKTEPLYFERIKEIINQHLPGPYTFILNKRKIVPRAVTSGSSYVGVRVPDNEIACRLASLFPITTTSANLSDEEVLSSPKEILEQLDCDVDLVIDVGELNSNHASKIVDLSGRNPKIIRK